MKNDEYKQIETEFIFLTDQYNFYIYNKYLRYGKYYVCWKRNNSEILVGYCNSKHSFPTIDIVEHNPLDIYKYKEENNCVSIIKPIERLRYAAEWLKEYMKDKIIQ